MNPTSPHWDLANNMCMKHGAQTQLPCVQCLTVRDPDISFPDPKTGAKMRYTKTQSQVRLKQDTELARRWARSAVKQAQAHGARFEVNQEMRQDQRDAFENEMERIRLEKPKFDIVWGGMGDEGYFVESRARR